VMSTIFESGDPGWFTADGAVGVTLVMVTAMVGGSPFLRL
jgi:hypothetical protein